MCTYFDVCVNATPAGNRIKTNFFFRDGTFICSLYPPCSTVVFRSFLSHLRQLKSNNASKVLNVAMRFIHIHVRSKWFSETWTVTKFHSISIINTKSGFSDDNNFPLRYKNCIFLHNTKRTSWTKNTFLVILYVSIKTETAEYFFEM